MLITAGVMALAVAPASAQRWTHELPLTAHGYTDARTPTATLTSESSPVGAWRDNQVHSAKAYFTVDLKPLRGKKIVDAHAYTQETAVTDCGKPRSVELWQTEVSEQPTWARAPRELSRSEGTFSGGCRGQGSWDVAVALTSAVASGAEKATFALRMAAERQFDVAFSRRYADLRFEAVVSIPPGAATDPQVNGKPCGQELFVGAQPSLRAQATGLQIRYVVTDVAAPAKRHEGVSNGAYQLPAGFVEHGHIYEWTARGEDGTDTGAPSLPCRFTADLVRPATGPVVTSADFPRTGAGFPGRITFDARGDTDVVEFAYEGQATGTVRADRPGGTATITVIVPKSFGDKVLDVRSVDRAGHASDATTFRFQVRSTAVYVFAPPVDDAVLGETHRFWFTSNEPNVTAYVYRVDDGPELTVPAPCDQCSGEAAIRVTSWSGTWVSVRARTAEGYLTEEGTSFTPTRPSWPLVSGGRDEIRIAPPNIPGTIAEYLYRINGGTEERTVAAEPDGTASVKIDFGTHPGPNVVVQGRTTDGLLTEPFTYYLPTTG